MKKYLTNTEILNFGHPSLQKIAAKRGWASLSEGERVKQVYTYVRDEILFGYNESDSIPASQVVADGYGQCNTKASLLMALLRAVGIPNRIHGFTIDKTLQKGAISGIWYRLSPRRILHSWVEVFLDEKWYFLEGVILDKPYLQALQDRFGDCGTSFCGYGAYTEDFKNPTVDWDFNHTFIQEKGIVDDFGLFDNPDDFYRQHEQALSPFKKWVYKKYVRHVMNRNVNRIREGGKQAR